MNKARSLRLKYNTISSLLYQIIALICGFVLPRLIMQTYGSNVNGLVNSITQFLQIISFLELGLGAVVQSALYKPLTDKNSIKISEILRSAEKFFRKIAIILVAYILLLLIIYPPTVKARYGFDWIYTALLLLAIGINLFSQYCFGIVDRLLLTADQHGYIQYTAQSITLIANTAACYILIQLGGSIQMVKMTTSLIYLIRPVFLRYYVNKHYKIDRKIKYKEEPIHQKWNGLTQHIAAVVLDGTDNIVLSVFSTLANVSIYSAYHLVIFGVKTLFLSLTNGMHALIGELWAKQELEQLNHTFDWFEWLLHTGTVFVFGCSGVLILPFVSVYTKGITDADYAQPLFALLITIANAGHCLRLPYNVMILAGGHYKQTQSNYIIAALLNICISIVMVIKFGLIGVAVGTLIAMIYQTVWMARYISKKLNHWPFRNFIKQISADILTVLIAAFASRCIQLGEINYFAWVIMATKVAVIWIAVVVGVNVLMYRDKMTQLLRKIIIIK